MSAESDTTSKVVVPPPKALIAAILKEAKGNLRDYVAIMLAALTGVRAGEQWALRWRHIEFERGYMQVETRVDRWRDEGGPKTRAGNRDVPLSASLMAELRMLQAESLCTPDDLIFAARDGRHIDHGAFKQAHFFPYRDRALEAWTVDSKLPPRPRWHDLRHFAISCWIEQGLSPKTIQTFAGHSDLATTMNRYGHLFPQEAHRITMDAIVGDILGV